MEFIKDIRHLHNEVDKRIATVDGEHGMYASKEEVRALRCLAGLLTSIFGPYPNVNFDGDEDQ
jgi:hypothetical protein